VAGLLGLLVLAASVLYVGLEKRSHAQGGSQASSSSGPRRAVAIAHVDLEHGLTNLHPVKPGRVVAVDAQEGKPYKEGDVLLRVDDSQEQRDVARARLDVQAAEERVKEANRLLAAHRKKVEAQKAAVEVARRDVEVAQALAARAKSARNKGMPGVLEEDVNVARKNVEKAKAALASQTRQLEALKAAEPSGAVRLADLDVKEKQEVLRKAEDALALCVVKAPVKGTVLRRQVNVGDVLGPAPRQPALIFAPAGPRIVRAEVEQEFAGRVREGQTATMQDEATGGGSWTGKVVRISDWYSHRRSVILEPTQFNDVRTLEVIIRFDPEPKKPLKIGQRVRVNLEGAP
jgi:multidrug resistance efflux pump